MPKAFALGCLFTLVLIIPMGCTHTHYLSKVDRVRADSLIDSLNKMEARFGRIDTRLREINSNAFKLRAELKGVRKGTENLHTKLSELGQMFGLKK